MSSGRIFKTAAVFLTLISGGAKIARAQQDPAVVKGLQFLRGRCAGGMMQTGEAALAALALIKSDAPANDPDLVRCINKIRERFKSAAFAPERGGGADIYEAGVIAMALSNYDAESRRGELSAVANYLLAKQNANGSWDYPHRQAGDTSITQYALLGLWEASNGGVDVPPEVWDRAAQWYLSVQDEQGAWNYHRDEPALFVNNISMTAAGTGSLLICQRQLAKHRMHSEATSSLLIPILAEGQRGRYEVQVSAARIDQAVRRGLAWIAGNITPDLSGNIGTTPYYCLYGIERVGALADRNLLGKVNWYELGRAYLYRTQQATGAWNSQHGEDVNTAWGVLFLVKSTAKTVAKIKLKQLGAGTLLGGRGLPRDLTNLTVAGGRVISRPMNGAVEGMLAVLEDPRAENADAALAGLVNKYRTDGPKVLRPLKDRFRKMLTDRDPGLRKIAAWSLARTGELDVAPSLIERLTDPEESVVGVAREGLMLLSRKSDGLGPPRPSTPEQRVEAAKRWRQWYDGIRPIDLEGQDDDVPGSKPTAAGRVAK